MTYLILWEDGTRSTMTKDEFDALGPEMMDHIKHYWELKEEDTCTTNTSSFVGQWTEQREVWTTSWRNKPDIDTYRHNRYRLKKMAEAVQEVLDAHKAKSKSEKAAGC